MGSRGRHKHVPQQAIDPFCQSHCSTTTISTGVLILQPSHVAEPVNNITFSFASLPGSTLSSIYGHLDCRSASQLARTCHACAAEYAQSKGLKRKWLSELAPSVICSTPERPFHPESDWSESLGESWKEWFLRFHKPKGLWALWQGNALQHVYALSDQPGFLDALWQAAVPASLCSRLLAHAVSEADSVQTGSDTNSFKCISFFTTRSRCSCHGDG